MFDVEGSTTGCSENPVCTRTLLVLSLMPSVMTGQVVVILWELFLFKAEMLTQQRNIPLDGSWEAFSETQMAAGPD